MTMSQTPTSQKVTKQHQLVRTLRDRIIDGSYTSGERLPTRVELEASFGVGWFTVQQAFDVLRREGFVHTDGRRGTFVVDRPPHLHRYVPKYHGA